MSRIKFGSKFINNSMFMPSEKRTLLDIQCALNTAISKPFACSYLNNLPILITNYSISENIMIINYSYAIDHMDGANNVFYSNEHQAKLTLELNKIEVFKDAYSRTNINYNGIKVVV